MLSMIESRGLSKVESISLTLSCCIWKSWDISSTNERRCFFLLSEVEVKNNFHSEMNGRVVYSQVMILVLFFLVSLPEVILENAGSFHKVSVLAVTNEEAEEKNNEYLLSLR